MDGEDKALHIESSVETSVGKSREGRLEMFMDTFSEEWKRSFDDKANRARKIGRRPMAFRDYASHLLDRIETDGFDIQDYSEFNGFGIMIQLYYPPEKPANDKYVAELEDCSSYAIEDYNRKHGTRYGNVHVLKANSETASPYRYYITFQATDENNNKQTFQARVALCFPLTPELQKDVEFVRIKAPPNPIVITRPRKAQHRGGQCSRSASMFAPKSASMFAPKSASKFAP